jgi:hypothetical protein
MNRLALHGKKRKKDSVRIDYRVFRNPHFCLFTTTRLSTSNFELCVLIRKSPCRFSKLALLDMTGTSTINRTEAQYSIVHRTPSSCLYSLLCCCFYSALYAACGILCSLTRLDTSAGSLDDKGYAHIPIRRTRERFYLFFCLEATRFRLRNSTLK